MERDSYVVIGKYRDPREVRETLDKLKGEGVAREDITLYSNRDIHDPFEDTMDLDARTPEDTVDSEERSIHDPFEDTKDLESRTRKDADMVGDDTDHSLWDEFKDLFRTDDDRDRDTTEEDFLAPHREDIRNGYTVIAVRNYTGDTNLDRDIHDKPPR